MIPCSSQKTVHVTSSSGNFDYPLESVHRGLYLQLWSDGIKCSFLRLPHFFCICMVLLWATKSSLALSCVLHYDRITKHGSNMLFPELELPALPGARDWTSSAMSGSPCSSRYLCIMQLMYEEIIFRSPSCTCMFSLACSSKFRQYITSCSWSTLTLQ